MLPSFATLPSVPTSENVGDFLPIKWSLGGDEIAQDQVFFESKS
jgi:hypothetical protein